MNDNFGQKTHHSSVNDGLNIDLIRVRQYREAIEVSVMINQYGECALLLNELINVIRKHFMTDENNNCSQRAIERAQDLLDRCHDPLQFDNDGNRMKLSDDIRNGLVLILGDLVGNDYYAKTMIA
jgi:hypothetical protein